MPLATQTPDLLHRGLFGWLRLQVPSVRSQPVTELDVANALAVAAFVPQRVAGPLPRGGQRAATVASLEARARNMKAGILVRRLERLEAEFAPTDDSDVLRVTVTRIGEPDKIIEVRSGKPKSLGPR